MTLNITLVTSSRIYQSSDFKLTIPATGEVVSLASTKLVQLQYPTFDGFLTYTGVGRWPRKDSLDTSARVVEWLSGASDLSLEQLVDKVREEGQRFLNRVEVTNGRQPHTFTVATFINGIPKVALISNYEYANGRTLPSLSPDLAVSDRAYRGSSFVVITGQRPAVHRDRRRQLERLGDLPASTPNQVRDSLARVNALAASSPASHNMVSADCSVLSLDASGRGYHELSPGSRVEPRFIMNGAATPDIGSLLRSLDTASNAIFAGGSFATSKQMDVHGELRT